MSPEEATETCYYPEYVIALQNEKNRYRQNKIFDYILQENCFELLSFVF